MKSDAFKVGELARRTGLTVRTLHHYDEIGLLRPSLHSDSGHRLYTEDDISKLQQIISLRQLGFSLEEIGDCLDRQKYSPLDVVHLHVKQLREQIELQRKLCNRLEALASHFKTAEKVSADEFLQIIEGMTMLENLYSSEQLKQFEEVGKQVGSAEIESVQNAWKELLNEVRANHHLDPAGEEAQSLYTRWQDLTARTMRGFQSSPELQEKIADNYKQGKFEGAANAPQAADFEFMGRVKAARLAQSE